MAKHYLVEELKRKHDPAAFLADLPETYRRSVLRALRQRGLAGDANAMTLYLKLRGADA